MLCLLQRVSQASVTVGGELIASIDAGLLVLVGVERGDGATQAKRMAERLLAYRVFSDENGKMNLSLNDTGGGLLLVPQFTLPADTGRGNRPSFAKAAPPELGRAMFNQLVADAKQSHPQVGTGQFAADMQVALINDGPVTFMLRVAEI